MVSHNAQSLPNMDVAKPFIDPYFDDCAEIRTHWEGLRKFFENWASKQDELLANRSRHAEPFLADSLNTYAESPSPGLEHDKRSAELPIVGTQQCGVPVDCNSGENNIRTEIRHECGDKHSEANAIDCECVPNPKRILQLQGLHASPRNSSPDQSSNIFNSHSAGEVARTSSWSKAVLRPSDSGLFSAIEYLKDAAGGRDSVKERWNRPEAPKSKSNVMPSVVSRASGPGRRSNYKRSETLQEIASLRQTIQDLANTMPDAKDGGARPSARKSRSNSKKLSNLCARLSNNSVREDLENRLSQQKIHQIHKKLTKQLDDAISEDRKPEELPCLKKFVLSNTFMALGGFTILVNAVLIAVETEYEANTLSTMPIATTLNMSLNIWYACEMVLKLYATGFGYFTGPDRKWNIMDMFLVIMSVIDMAFTTKGVVDKQGMGRALRAVRLARLMRNLRLVRFFDSVYDFQRMTVALTSCLGTLFWSVMMLACVTWTFAVCMTQFVSSLRRGPHEGEAGEYSELQEYFGNTPVAMHCLIQSATAGVSWGSVSSLLFSIDIAMGVLYLCYISLTIFGVLNVVTSVFVESALQTSQHYRELLVEQNRRNKEYYASHVREIFKVIDEDDSGLVSLPEIESIFCDPSLQEFIDALEVNATDATMLFNLLDYDGSGEIDVEEFCDGCLRLKGEAKSFDVYCLIYENERNLRFSKIFMAAMADTLKSIGAHVNFLSQKLKESDQKIGKLSFHVSNSIRERGVRFEDESMDSSLYASECCSSFTSRPVQNMRPSLASASSRPSVEIGPCQGGASRTISWADEACPNQAKGNSIQPSQYDVDHFWAIDQVSLWEGDISSDAA